MQGCKWGRVQGAMRLDSHPVGVAMHPIAAYDFADAAGRGPEADQKSRQKVCEF